MAGWIGRSAPLALALALALASACASDTVPDGALTPPGDGPRVAFDLERRPWPTIPLPNDLATFPDPTSRTGRRLNFSTAGSTELESAFRAGLARNEGWSTFAPITVSFEKPPRLGGLAPAIDVAGVSGRTRDYDPSDDPFYVVDLTTGLPVPLDVGKSSFPISLVAAGQATDDTLLFPTVEEGAALGQRDYTPAIDTDFDGVVDHPNILEPPLTDPAVIAPPRARVGAVLDWYERETDTLRLRPVVPLEEKREYAVILTDRLRGVDGTPVRSPFDRIHHPAQQAGAERVEAILADPFQRAWFGDLAGTGLARVTFLWTFTTAPVHEDMRLLRDGLYATGPFARLAGDFQPKTTDRATTTPECFAGSGQNLDAVERLIVGTFESPQFLADDAAQTGATFDVDFRSGGGSIGRAVVPYILVIPKASGARKAPFPVTVWSQGAALREDELLARATTFAEQGVALFLVPGPGHGFVLDPDFTAAATRAGAPACLTTWVRAITAASPNAAAAPLAPAAPLTTRDAIRQAAIHALQATRAARARDGGDAGGPLAPLTAAGDGPGAIAAMIAGSIDPNVVAVAPVAGGGGLADLLARAAFDVGSPLERVLGPSVVGVRSDLVPKVGDASQTRCVGPERSVRLVVNDGGRKVDLELACLKPAELDPGKTVVVENVVNHERRCARTGNDGAFVIPFPASDGDRLDVQIYGAPDAVDSYGACNVVAGAPPLRRIKTFEQPVAAAPSAADAKACSAAALATEIDPAVAPDAGCQAGGGRAFPVGSALVAPKGGLGLLPQSADLRRFIDLIQIVLDAADPVNFAPYYGLRTSFGPDGAPLPPRGLFAIPTTGDAVVPTSTSYAFARAAGLVPFLPPTFAGRYPTWAEYATPQALFDRLRGRTPNEVLVETHVLEGAARLHLSAALPTCFPNYAPSPRCTRLPNPSACDTALSDPDWLSEGKNPWTPEHPPEPLRLVRSADVRAVDAASLGASWQPRLASAPFVADDAGWRGNGPLAGVVAAWIEPGGSHGFGEPDRCRRFEDALYYERLLVRFLATSGRDVYFTSHPASHLCLEQASCPFFQ